MSTIPKRLGGAKEFRKQKRYQLRLLESTLKPLRFGCAFFPENGVDDFAEIESAVARLKIKLSSARWGH